jgi:hypothetical protein
MPKYSVGWADLTAVMNYARIYDKCELFVLPQIGHLARGLLLAGMPVARGGDSGSADIGADHGDARACDDCS